MTEKNIKDVLKEITVPIREEHKMETLKHMTEEYEQRRCYVREKKSFGKFIFLQVQKKMMGSIILQLTALIILLMIINRFYSEAEYVLSRHLSASLAVYSIIVAISSMPILGRAQHHNMIEVEAAAFLGRGKLTLIHMGIIFSDNVIFLGMAAFLTSHTMMEGAGYSIWHILLPYFLAGSGCVAIQRSAAVNLSFNYIIYGVALILGVVGISHLNPVIYGRTYYGAWMVLCIGVCVTFFYQVFKSLQNEINI